MKDITVTIAKVIILSDLNDATELKLKDTYTNYLHEFKEVCGNNGIVNTKHLPPSYLAKVTIETNRAYYIDILSKIRKLNMFKDISGDVLEVADILINVSEVNIEMDTMSLSLTLISNPLKVIDTVSTMILLEHPQHKTRVLTFEMDTFLFIYTVVS